MFCFVFSKGSHYCYKLIEINSRYNDFPSIFHICCLPITRFCFNFLEMRKFLFKEGIYEVICFAHATFER